MQREISPNKDCIKYNNHKAELELMNMNAKFAATEASKDTSYERSIRERDEKAKTYKKRMKTSYFGINMVSLAHFSADFVHDANIKTITPKKPNLFSDICQRHAQGGC